MYEEDILQLFAPYKTVKTNTSRDIEISVSFMKYRALCKEDSFLQIN